MAGGFRFTREERIVRSHEFAKVIKKGRRRTSENFVVYVLNNGLNFQRLGVIAKKEVGPATFRNRIRRYAREFFRLYKARMKGSSDLVVMIRKGCSVCRYREAESELRRLLVS
jgi:ribonuclease P protein component